MTTSVVAVITDVVREGRPVAGFAFNSTGRYACGAQMRDRFIPRILKAPPKSLVNSKGDNLDPEKFLACMMQREKPGGHTERSVAIGTIEVAVWDAVAKIVGKPLHRVLAERYNKGKYPKRVPCYVGGGWYEPGKGLQDLQDEIRAKLDQGYGAMKIKVGGATIPQDVKRVEAALKVVRSSDQLAVDANAGVRPRTGVELRQGARAVRAALVRGTVRPARLHAARRRRARLRRAARHRRESLFHAGRAEPGELRGLARRPRHPADGRAAVLRHRAVLAHARDARAARLEAEIGVPSRRQPDDACTSSAVSGSAGARRIRGCSVRSRDSRTMQRWRTATSAFPTGQGSASRARMRCMR